MTIKINGKEYATVAERLVAAHAEGELKSVETEVLLHDPVVVKATISTTEGVFTGISAANPTKSIEKASPYEVAETSAVGRALAFAGYATTAGIASADEMQKEPYGDSEGLNKLEFAKLRDGYANQNIVPPLDRWELMNYEQKKTINDIKLTKKNDTKTIA